MATVKHCHRQMENCVSCDIKSTVTRNDVRISGLQSLQCSNIHLNSQQFLSIPKKSCKRPRKTPQFRACKIDDENFRSIRGGERTTTSFWALSFFYDDDGNSLYSHICFHPCPRQPFFSDSHSTHFGVIKFYASNSFSV